MFTARYELYLKIIFRLVFVFKRVKHSEPFSTRMYAEAKILNKTFSSVHAKFAFHERLTVVCSETIYAQTLLTSGSCIHMLLRTLKKKAKVSFVDAPQILKGHHFGRKVPRFCPIIFLLKASLKIQWVWVWVWVCECVCVWVSECVCVWVWVCVCEALVELYCQGKGKYSKRKLAQCHCVHHQSNRDWPGNEYWSQWSDSGDWPPELQAWPLRLKNSTSSFVTNTFEWAPFYLNAPRLRPLIFLKREVIR